MDLIYSQDGLLIVIAATPYISDRFKHGWFVGPPVWGKHCGAG